MWSTCVGQPMDKPVFHASQTNLMPTRPGGVEVLEGSAESGISGCTDSSSHAPVPVICPVSVWHGYELYHINYIISQFEIIIFHLFYRHSPSVQLNVPPEPSCVPSLIEIQIRPLFKHKRELFLYPKPNVGRTSGHLPFIPIN